MKKILIAVGFLIIACCAGACDLNTLSNSQCIVGSLSGLSLMVIGDM